MGLKEGFGEKLTEGSYRLAESYGVPELSMSVKKNKNYPPTIQGEFKVMVLPMP